MIFSFQYLILEMIKKERQPSGFCLKRLAFEHKRQYFHAFGLYYFVCVCCRSKYNIQLLLNSICSRIAVMSDLDLISIKNALQNIHENDQQATALHELCCNEGEEAQGHLRLSTEGSLGAALDRGYRGRICAEVAEGQSLMEQVLELRAPSKEFEFRAEMLRAFEGGIDLPIFARHLGWLPKGSEEGSQRKFVFCPTFLTAKPMFQYLEREGREDVFVWGPPGIAKTASVVLYLHLNNYITRFFFEAQSDPAKLEELRELQQRRLLKTTAFKYFYWGLTNAEHNTERLIESLIVEQATELDEATRNALSNQTDPLKFCRLLRSHYPKNIELRSIIDQLNILTNMMYKCYQEKRLHLYLKGCLPSVKEKQIIKKREDRSFDQFFIPMLKRKCNLFLINFLIGRYCAISSYPVQNWGHETDSFLQDYSFQNKQDFRKVYRSPSKLTQRFE